MANGDTNIAGGNVRRSSRFAKAFIPVSRAFYRTGLWLVYGGAAAEMIFRDGAIDDWSSGFISAYGAAGARS